MGRTRRQHRLQGLASWPPVALPSRRHGPARGESLPLAAVLVLLAMSAVALVLAATATTGAARSRVDPYRRRGPVP